MRIGGSFCLAAALLPASAWAQVPTDVTGLAGFNTAVRAGQVAAVPGALNTSGNTLTCPRGMVPPPHRTSIPACDTSKVTRPSVEKNGQPESACPGMNDSRYQQIVFLMQQTYRLMASRADLIALKMTCLIGVPVSAADVTDALAEMSDELCATGANAKRNFVVSCDQNLNASADFGAGMPYDSQVNCGNQFCGSIDIKPSFLDSVDAAENSRDYNDQATADRRKKRQDITDTFVHENTHALASFLQKRFAGQGASMTNPPAKCPGGVGRLTRQYRMNCGNSFTTSSGPVTYRIGNDMGDQNNYRPYPDLAYLNTNIATQQTWLRQHGAQARALEARVARNPNMNLSSAQQTLISNYDSYTQGVATMQSQLPCAQAYSAANPPGAITQVDWDASMNTCGVPPSGTYRNEAAARSVAMMVTGVGCQQADGFYFNSYGGLQKQ